MIKHVSSNQFTSDELSHYSFTRNKAIPTCNKAKVAKQEKCSLYIKLGQNHNDIYHMLAA